MNDGEYGINARNNIQVAGDRIMYEFNKITFLFKQKVVFSIHLFIV